MNYMDNSTATDRRQLLFRSLFRSDPIV